LTDTSHQTPTSSHTLKVTSEVLPGGNRATLTLPNGKVITLSEAETGIVIHPNRITYQDHSKPIASLTPRVSGELILATPNGGTYQVTLPDGSEVWLNAASKLTYPTRFPGTDRTVVIAGEAYFSITKQSHKP